MLEPLAAFPLAARRDVSIVLTDIDDTLTEHGRLPALAYGAMAELQAAGLAVVPVTGRPAGWCDLIARQWPVSGVVGENGAFYFRYNDQRRAMTRRYAKSEAERAADRERLREVRAAVLAEVPGAAVAADQTFREADLAIDFCEDVAPLPAADVQRIVAIFERLGAVAKVSSIHVNGWFGGYDKLTTSRVFLHEVLALDIDASPERVVFIGDSPNDAPMFGFFPNAVGVSNVLDFRDSLEASPRWITRGRSAHGFREVADALIAARR
jgi:HAD superfamily hydrolase (TIGR01484 family)